MFDMLFEPWIPGDIMTLGFAEETVEEMARDIVNGEATLDDIPVHFQQTVLEKMEEINGTY